jgi:hypothetical protein
MEALIDRGPEVFWSLAARSIAYAAACEIAIGEAAPERPDLPPAVTPRSVPVKPRGRDSFQPRPLIATIYKISSCGKPLLFAAATAYDGCRRLAA